MHEIDALAVEVEAHRVVVGEHGQSRFGVRPLVERLGNDVDDVVLRHHLPRSLVRGEPRAFGAEHLVAVGVIEVADRPYNRGYVTGSQVLPVARVAVCSLRR